MTHISLYQENAEHVVQDASVVRSVFATPGEGLVKTGDSFNGTVTGVMSYGYSNYKVLTNKAELPALVEENTAREVTSLEVDRKNYQLLENFSTKTPDSKVQTIAESIIMNLKQPDIIGLTEMQDNDG